MSLHGFNPARGPRHRSSFRGLTTGGPPKMGRTPRGLLQPVKTHGRVGKR